MTVPTNKLKDLVVSLSQLDQDAQHLIVHVDTTVTKAGKRILHMRTAEPAFDFEDFLCDLYEDLHADDQHICEDTNDPNEFILKLTAHFAGLHREIQRLESTHSTPA